ncbi:hypothetical protein QNM99_21055 [Pseudomonas sp. PCH446]
MREGFRVAMNLDVSLVLFVLTGRIFRNLGADLEKAALQPYRFAECNLEKREAFQMRRCPVEVTIQQEPVQMQRFRAFDQPAEVFAGYGPQDHTDARIQREDHVGVTEHRYS